MPRKRRQRYADYFEIRNGDIYARALIPIGNGKYKTRRKKVESKTEARQWALDEIATTKHGSDSLTNFLEAVEWYKRHYLTAPVYEKGLKVEGIKDWKRRRAKLDAMAHHFGPKSIRSFSYNDMLGYARARREVDKVSTATLNRDFALLRSLFRQLHDKDSTVRVPKFPINIAAEQSRERVMSSDEEKRLLAVCTETEERVYVRNGKESKAHTSKARREHLRAVIILAVDTAMRSGEIFSLEWSDIDFESGTITVQAHNTKTQRSRKIGMTPRVRRELEALRKPKGKVFGLTTARKAFATGCRRAGLTDLHFHDLRHTATTRMIRAGIPHTEVMKITGHTQMKTFLRYLNPEDSTVQSTAQMLAAYLNDE